MVHVGDVDVAGGALDGDVARHVQVRAGRRSAVADIVASRFAGRAVAGDRVDETGLAFDHPHAVVERVGDVDVAVRRRGNGARRVQRGLDRRLLVAVVAVLPRSGDRDDDAGLLVDPPHSIVVRVGDDDVAVGRNRHAVWCVELRENCRAIVAGEAAAEVVIAGDRLDVRIVARIDAADDVVVRVGEINVTVRRDDDAVGRVEPGFDRRAVVAGVAFLAADHRSGGRFAQHERARADRQQHHREDERAAQTVDAHDRWRDERHARRARRHRDHAGADGHLLDAAPRNRGGLRRSPEHGGDEQHRQAGDDRAGERPAQCHTRRRAAEQSGAEADRGDEAKYRRPQMHADADERLAGGVLLDQHADVEPCPAAGEDADVAIVGPAFVGLDRSHRARSAQPVAELSQHAIGRGPGLAPEAILGDAAGRQEQRAPRLGPRRPRTAAGLRLRVRERDLGR